VLEVTVNEDAGTASFPVRLTGDLPAPFIVTYETTDDTANNPSDYTTTAGNLNFIGTNDEIQLITVPIIDDAIIEPTERYQVNLLSVSNPLLTINAAQANGNIIDNDAVAGTGIAFTNTNVILTEGTDTFARFTVTLTGTISENVTVDYVTNDGTALNGSDITAQSGTITFTPSVSSFDIDVPILDDTIIEATEDFTVVLSNIQSNIGIGFVNGDTTNTATGTINDDDSDPSLGVQF
ncbi:MULTISPECIES: Calx-beta domain-containing protein, partial [unclassified Croceitalea]|uniref:Calx-beta domain-containing protein n=1 Tax=unclassified Croceitalea TaxID=2632280 RepID=UPI0030DB3EB7